MRKSMFLVEVYNNAGELHKRRLSDDLGNIEDWIENVIIGKDYPYDKDYRLEKKLDDYCCGEIIHHNSHCEHTVVFTIKTVSIGII